MVGPTIGCIEIGDRPGQFGNIGWFRVIAGWHHCDVPGLTNMMSAQIYIATQVPVQVTTWGGIKALYRAEEEEPGPDKPKPEPGRSP